MKLNKKQIYPIVVFAVILIVFNILAFVIPFSHNGPYWLGYVFGMISIMLQAPIAILAFGNATTARSRFYGIPIARVGVLYFVVQMGLSFAAMAMGGIDNCKTWPFVLIFLLLLSAAIIGVIATDSSRDEIERQDTELNYNVSNMRSLQSIGRSLTSLCSDGQISEDLRKLADDLRFSDPVSNSATIAMEEEISALMDELQKALLENDTSGASALCAKVRVILAERNRVCKLNK